jgi:myosin heavy chain 9/10/11/14
MKQLEKSLEAAESARSFEARSIRSVDRTVKDLQSQIDRREKIAASLEDDLNRQRERVGDLLKSIDDLQSVVSEKELITRRTERELKEEREKALRLERELEGWKGLRFERSVRGGSGSLRVPSSQLGSIRGRREGSVALSVALRGNSPAPSSIAAVPPITSSNADKQPSVEPEAETEEDEGKNIPPRALRRVSLRRVSNSKGFL